MFGKKYIIFIRKPSIFIVAILFNLLVPLAAVIAQAQPSDTSVSGLFNLLKSETGPVQKENLLRIITTKPKTKNSQLLLDAGAQYVAVAFAEIGDVKKAQFWIRQIVQPMWKNWITWSVVHQLVEIGKLDDATKIILPIISPAGYPSDTTAKSIADEEKGWLSCEYGIIKYKQGRYKEALPYLAPSSERKVRDGAELYVLALIKTGNQKQAVTEADLLMSKVDRVGETFRTEIKPVFFKTYGNNDHYQMLLDSISAKYNRQLAVRLLKSKISEPAPSFEIKDLNGKLVSLQSLKGKTVVIDFWATWCIPCISSFPGMQKAIDYYKNDTSVVFMFVHTWEKTANVSELAKKMISNKGYTFDVYMDLKNKETGKNPLSEAFKLTALPTKLVIDKNGIVRFKNTGAISADDALPEIKAMVDLSQK